MVFMKQLVVRQFEEPEIRSCVSLSFEMQEPFYMNMWSNTSHSLGLFLINFKISMEDLKIKETTLYLTSEINSYGAVYLRWFDGEAKPFNLKMGQYHNIQINKIMKYEYNRSLLLKRNFYFARQIYTTKQVTCFSIYLINQRQMDQNIIF